MEQTVTITDENGKAWIGDLIVDFNAGRGRFTEQEQEEFFSLILDFVDEHGVAYGENGEESIHFEVANESQLYKEMDAKLGDGSAKYFAEDASIRFSVERI